MGRIACIISVSILLFFSDFFLSNLTDASSPNSDYISTSCAITRFPEICVRTLSPFADNIGQDRLQLARTALLVSLTRVQSSETFIRKLTNQMKTKREEAAVMEDLVESMGSSVSRLKDSLVEMKLVGAGEGENAKLHLSNAQTWVSAALTNFNTCLDEFSDSISDRKVREVTVGIVQNAFQVTSNALAFLNQIQLDH